MVNQIETDLEYSYQIRENILNPTTIPDRVHPFRKIANFRDLGGYPTLDGRVTRWHKLYRSGHLAHATNPDLKKFSRLGIHTLVDFRSDQEREREPDQLPANHEIRTLSFPIQENGKPLFSDEIRQMINERRINGQDPSLKMQEMYVQLATRFTDSYRNYFQALIEAEGKPVLWHCSAGKDRAGFAAAVLLKILGVSDQIIMEDYMLSQDHVVPRRGQLMTIRLLKGEKAYRYVNRMNDVDPNWLRAAFQTINEEWGNFLNYVRKGLKLYPSDVEYLKVILLDFD
jgi:protein-tyrosine phosphatase